MDIRPREPHDLGACVRVLAEVHHGDGYPADWPGSPARWLSPPALLGAWVAVERDGPPAGHITLSRSGPGDAAPELWSRRTGAPAGAAAVIGRLFVSPADRGRGAGALLMGRAVRAAGERGLHPVLDVLDSDTAAAALYERLGWALLGTAEQRWSPTRTVTVRCYAAPAGLPADSPADHPTGSPAPRPS
ncbi:GNAT family N-acetyltransferase [Streptomyces sp. NPDC059982]|uniref:GNAT family N-acetyltransferase n=1 Tax=unclassified Streptomyces TaxID=2593676 RepID=UPI0036BF9559